MDQSAPLHQCNDTTLSILNYKMLLLLPRQSRAAVSPPCSENSTQSILSAGSPRTHNHPHLDHFTCPQSPTCWQVHLALSTVILILISLPGKATITNFHSFFHKKFAFNSIFKRFNLVLNLICSSFCLKQLNKGTFKEQGEKPYCHECFDRLFG